LVDLREILGGEASRLVDELRQLPTDALRAERLDGFLAARAGRCAPAPRCVRGGLEILRASGGRTPVPALARDVGVTERSLLRAFREHVGVPPKTLARIVRIHAVLERVGRAEGASWARLAQEHGFADQAHLGHEFRDLTGTSPGQFVRERRLSEFYNPLLGFDVSFQGREWKPDHDAPSAPPSSRRRPS
jgi:AraC-like DNA-binding protein